MLRTLICCAAMLLATGFPSMAKEWVFHYGPEFGAEPIESYAQVFAGSNSLRVHAYGDKGAIALSALFDSFENGEALERSLRAGEPLRLDVLQENDRYVRIIPNNEYLWKDRPDDDDMLVFFFLTVDDLFAMAEGRAVFIWAGSVQFRFGMDRADIALRKLISAMGEDLN